MNALGFLALTLFALGWAIGLGIAALRLYRHSEYVLGVFMSLSAVFMEVAAIVAGAAFMNLAIGGN